MLSSRLDALTTPPAHLESRRARGGCRRDRGRRRARKAPAPAGI